MKISHFALKVDSAWQERETRILLQEVGDQISTKLKLQDGLWW